MVQQHEPLRCAKQREMSSKGLQSLCRKPTCGNENQQCTVLLSSNQSKTWLRHLNENNGTESRTQANLKNHSDRKTMIQTLVNNDLLPTDIMQLSGHKNAQSITSYSTISQKQHFNMSHTLIGLSSAERTRQSGSSILEKRKHAFDELIYPTFHPTFSQQSKQAAT